METSANDELIVVYIWDRIQEYPKGWVGGCDFCKSSMKLTVYTTDMGAWTEGN
jgi:hypothetical protein